MIMAQSDVWLLRGPFMSPKAGQWDEEGNAKGFNHHWAQELYCL